MGKRILCVIDTFKIGGGAQTQLAGLAVMLKQNHYDVTALSYHEVSPEHSCEPYLTQQGIDYIITTIPNQSLIRCGFVDQFSDIWKVIIASILMGGITLIVGEIQLPIIFVLTIQIIIAIISYIVLCRLLKIEAFNDLIFIFLHNIKRK